MAEEGGHERLELLAIGGAVRGGGRTPGLAVKPHERLEAHRVDGLLDPLQHLRVDPLP
jgi:hypothetical protein